MIFYIGDNCPAKDLKQVAPRLFLDDGWQNVNDIWYKGYSTDCVLSESIDDIIHNGYQPDGKWCVIHEEKIYHPLLRGFPVHVKNDEKTNLKPAGFEKQKYNTKEMPLVNEILSIEEVAYQIGDILVENTSNFYKYNKPENMAIYLSAGLDTMTNWVIQEQVSTDFDLLIHLPTPEDTTFKTWVGTEWEYETDVMDMLADSYWGYIHPSYYKKLNWVHSGYYAETYTYRDLTALSGFVRYLGKNCISELTTENDYYHLYLKRPNAIELANEIMTYLSFADEDALRKYLWSTIWYDHQMWHLDNNMFFCPFADVRIPEIAMKLSIEDIIRISVHGDIQRHIIERFKPGATALLSDYKNEGKIWKNFKANFNESMVHPNTRLIYR